MTTHHRRVKLVVLDGLISYDNAHALQLEKVELRSAGEIPDTLILLEHQPVITLGRNANPSDIVAPSDLLSSHDIPVRHTERGGQATYHGPGQVVGYPILNLKELGIGVNRYVANLEETMIRAAKKLGVESGRRKGMPGVFCTQGKIGAIGVRVTRNVTFHGFAFNVNPDLAHYRLIIPCGMTDTKVTSIAAASASSPSISQARKALIESFIDVFGLRRSFSS